MFKLVQLYAALQQTFFSDSDGGFTINYPAKHTVHPENHDETRRVQRLKRPKYQVECYDPSWDGAGRVGWVADGPVFTNKEDAKAYMDTLDEYPGTVRIKPVALFPIRPQPNNSTRKTAQRPWWNNNYRNGDASIEIGPGIFATYEAYWFLRELDDNSTTAEDPVDMLRGWKFEANDDDLPF